MKTAKDRVLEELQKNGARAIPELARVLNIPISTVRFTLLQLSVEGKVKRRQLSPKIILWEVSAR